MKKSIIILSCVLIFLSACQREDIISLPVDQKGQEVEETRITAYVLSMNDGIPVYEPITTPLEELLANPVQSEASKKIRDGYTKGNFSMNGGNMNISFSGQVRQGQISGSGEFRQSLPFGDVHLYLDAECVTIDGSSLVYGGTISKVFSSPFPPGGPFDPGNILYFMVKDNADGTNGGIDQHSNTLVIFPSFAGSGCGSLLPTSSIWTSCCPLVSLQNPSEFISVSN